MRHQYPLMDQERTLHLPLGIQTVLLPLRKRVVVAVRVEAGAGVEAEAVVVAAVGAVAAVEAEAVVGVVVGVAVVVVVEAATAVSMNLPRRKG